MADARNDWLLARLTDELDELPKTLERIPADRWTLPPPGDLGEWSVHRQLVHLANLEGRAVLPVLRHLLEGLPVDPRYTGTPEQRAELVFWETAPAPSHLIDQWIEARRAILAFARPLTPAQWVRAVPHPAFGPASVEWCLLKLHQHTLDHLNTFLKLALWWDLDIRPKLNYDAL